MKIKTFKFYVSNSAMWNRVMGSNQDRWDDIANERTPISSMDEIDNVINKFIEDKDVVNIIINDFTSVRHNNGRSDTVERTYTIMYKDVQTEETCQPLF